MPSATRESICSKSICPSDVLLAPHGACLCRHRVHGAGDRLRWIPSPGRVRISDLALHKEGVGIEDHIVAHGDAVVDVRGTTQRASAADSDRVALENAFLEG